MRLVRHRGKWAVRIDGKRLSTGYDATSENREAAQRKGREILSAINAPEVELGAIMQAYALDKESQGRDGQRTRTSWRALKPTFGGLHPDQITRALCQEYADKRPVSNGTITRDLKALKAACSWNGPNKGQFWYPPATEPRDRHISKDEMRALIEATDTFHLKVFLHLAYATAARAGALYELTWLQVNWSNNSIFLGRKANGKKRATVPMTDTLKAILEEAHKIKETGHVLEWAGEPIKSVRTAFEKACAKAGIDDFRIHDIRHTAAVHMAGDGVRMEKISQYLGHSNIHVTSSIYARYQPEHLRNAASALEL